MNYTFKLSRRLARFKAASVLAASLFTLSCAADGPNEPGSPTDPTRVSISPETVTLGINQSTQFEASMDSSTSSPLSFSKGTKGRGRNAVVDLTVSPNTYTLAEGSAASFTAVGTLRDGSVSAPSVTWTATGGTIDASGKYTAGPISGNYSVSAKASNGVADTAIVILAETTPTATDISLSPTSTSLPAGGSKQFTAVGKASDGATVPVSPKYAATGGTVSSTGMYKAGQTPGAYRIIATDTVSSLADTSAVTITGIGATLQSVVLIPATASVAQGAKQQFSASGKMSDGSSVPLFPSFAATGGSISSSGEYTAGSTAGTYRVIAADTVSGNADTSSVTITASPATLQAVVLTPATASLAAGATQQFTASGKMSDGSTSAVTVTWSAAGGTISSAGFYTAGQTAGTFGVIAKQSGGSLADTATVTVTAPTTPPPPTASASCPSTGYTRLVEVNTAPELTAAVNGALAGDQIRLAPGNYNFSDAVRLTRSGTAANRITLCGPRTAIVNAYVWTQASYWHVLGFRITGQGPYTNKVWGVYQNMGGNNIYESLEVDHQNQEGIEIHDGPSYNNVIRYNYIHDTGRVRANRGEGIYLGNGDTVDQIVDNTWVHHNTIVNVPGEGIEVKAGTSGQIIEFNTITNAGYGGGVGSDVPIQIRGNNNIVRDNTIIGSPRYSIENFADTPTGGMNNLYERNTASGAGNNKMFSFGTNAGSPLTGNVVKCSNVAVAPMVLNVTCKQ